MMGEKYAFTFLSMTMELKMIGSSEHNLYNSSFFVVKAGILERIRFNIEYS